MARGDYQKRASAGQLPLLTPGSEWTTPSELPDLRKMGRVGADTETKDDGLAQGRGPGWVYGAGYVCGISMAAQGRPPVYAPLRHPDSDCLDRDTVRRWWVAHATAPDLEIVFQNAQYDLGWLWREFDAPVPPRIHDSSFMAVMLDEHQLSYSLDSICLRLGLPGKDETLLRDAAAAYGVDPKGGLWRLPARYVGPYAEQDAQACLSAADHLLPILEREEMADAYQLEIDLIPLMIEMRRRGVKVDVDRALVTKDRLLSRRDEVLKDLSRRLSIGRDVTIKDVASEKFLEKVFEAEGVPFPRTSKTGQGSFKSDWMEKRDHWLPQLVCRALQMQDAGHKFVGGYILDFSHRGRIHADTHQLRGGGKNDDATRGTRTTRFSYSDPPLQQMTSPDKHEEVGLMIRDLFEPEDGEIWGAADYCHDDQTDILTDRGWVRFSELSLERVAQWDAGRITFVEPTSRYVSPIKTQPMVHVRGTRQVDFVVTEDHRCLLFEQNSDTPIVVSGKDFGAECADRVVLQAGEADGEETVPDDLLKLAVACQADGSDRTLTEASARSWRFYLKKQRKIDRLCDILHSLNIPYQLTDRAKGDQTSIRFHSPAAMDELLSRKGKGFDTEKMLSLSSSLRRLFLEEVMLWDGSGSRYVSTVRENVECVQAVASITGRRAASVVFSCKNKKTIYGVTVSSKRDRTWLTPSLSVRTLPYTGKVYCVTVPSGFIVTRREGHVLVSGNCQQEPALTVHFASLCGVAGAEKAVDYYHNAPKPDYHTMVAQMTGLPRPKAKIINLGLSYGMGKYKLAAQLGVSLDEADRILKQYHDEVPFVRRLGEYAGGLAARRGWLRLLDGARVHFERWEPKWRDRSAEEAFLAQNPGSEALLVPCGLEEAQRRASEPGHPWRGARLKRAFTHKAMNALVQGSAARQTKLAMRACWQEGLVPLLQMHDELDFSLSSEVGARRVAQIMVEVAKLRVPVRVDSEFGPTWGRARKSDGYGATWAEATQRRAAGCCCR